MARRNRSLGFSLIEVLIVMAIIGALSAIAIPALMGQRKKARLIGDAQSNARVIAMGMETRKAENGSYGVAGGTWKWTGASDIPSNAATNPVPAFAPKGNTKMTYTLTLGTALTYNLDVKEGTTTIYRTDQTGRQIYP